jgi:guanylate kinase
MRHWEEFDYVIINQDFATAVSDLDAIVRATRLAVARQRARHARLLQELFDK